MEKAVLQMVVKKFVLQQLDPKKDTGTFDPRVFKGGNFLSAIKDAQTGLWKFKMEHGLPPAPLRDRFSDFNALKRHAESYFTTKSIKIVDVI